MATLQVDVTSPHSFEAEDGTLVHVIDSTPAMPPLTATAQLTEVTGEIELAAVPFSWRLTIEFDEDGRSDLTNVPPEGWTQETGGVWEIQIPQGFTAGGVLTVYAGADLPDGTPVEGDSTQTAMRVLGQNPPKDAIRQQIIDGTVYQAVFWKESRLTQFRDGAGVANDFVDGAHGPIRGHDPGGTVGWGMGQLTTPTPSIRELWDWTANVRGSVQRLRQFRADAAVWPRCVPPSSTTRREATCPLRPQPLSSTGSSSVAASLSISERPRASMPRGSNMVRKQRQLLRARATASRRTEPQLLVAGVGAVDAEPVPDHDRGGGCLAGPDWAGGSTTTGSRPGSACPARCARRACRSSCLWRFGGRAK
jgi:hypothetical protein